MIDVGISTHTYVSPSSSIVPVHPAAVELLTARSKVLSRWGRWYVFGAHAVIAYGVPRLSADVDITLDLVPNDPATELCYGKNESVAGYLPCLLPG